MRIPSGDLAPARKHRRYGRRRNPLPIVLAVLLVLAIAGVAYVLRRGDQSAGRVNQAVRCSAPSPAPAQSTAAPQSVVPLRLPAAGQVRLRLLNGSSRDLLARSVGNELARRGFHVTAMGNAPRPLAGASRVYYGPGARGWALLVSAHVLGASVQPVGNAAPGAVDVVLGSTFVRLRTAAEASSFAHTIATGTAPAATPAAPKPAASTTCR